MKTQITIFSILWILTSPAFAAEPQQALAAIRSEPKVKDVIYSEKDPIQWQVGVLTDGSPRYGYASYLCSILQEHGIVTPNTWIRIVDIAKISQGNNFREASLGRVNCHSFEKSMP